MTFYQLANATVNTMNAAYSGTRTGRGMKVMDTVAAALPAWTEGIDKANEQGANLYSHPAAVEFASLLRPWLSDETILLEDVDASDAGVIDLVLVGVSATIGIQFDTRAVSRPAPYFTDYLYVMSPLDVIDSANELLYILMKSTPSLFSERARHRLPRLARIDKFKFAKPKQDGYSAYEISSVSRRTYPVVMQVLGSRNTETVPTEPVVPAAA